MMGIGFPLGLGLPLLSFATGRHLKFNGKDEHPAVQERLNRLQRQNVVEGFTVKMNPNWHKSQITTFIALVVIPKKRPASYPGTGAHALHKSSMDGEWTFRFVSRSHCTNHREN